jgi:hypothetical protein
MQKQQIRENKMKKGLLALSAATLFVMTTPVQAKQEICVFDLLGKAHAGRSAVLYGLDLYHKTRPLLFHRLTKLAKATRKAAVKLRHIRRFSQTF